MTRTNAISSLFFLFLLFLAGAMSVSAQLQQYVISTYAGGALPPGPTAEWDVSIATDAAGNAYFTSQNCVFKQDPNGLVTRIAGNSKLGYSGDGGPAINAQLYTPMGLAADAAGNLFIADSENHHIRWISTDGIIATVAGSGTPGYSGDGGPATSAQLFYPTSLAIDGGGNLYVVDAEFLGFTNSGNRVRNISPDGIITTVAGGGPCCSYAGDGVHALDANLIGPNRIAVGGAGNLYITEPITGRIHKVSPDGTLTTVAGKNRPGTDQFPSSCSAGSSGDGGLAIGATLCLPYGVAVDSAGNVFIAEYGYRCCYDIDDPIIENFVVREVSLSGIISTVPGSATPGITACDCDDIGSGFVAVDSSGDVFLSDSLLIRKIAPDGSVTTIADASVNPCCFSGDGGPATTAELYSPVAVAIDSANNIFIADTYNYRVRRVSPDGIITTVAGNGTPGSSGDGGPAINAQVWGVTNLAVDGEGNLFIADHRNGRVRKVASDGTIVTVAGGGTVLSDGISATSAMLSPTALAVDAAGNLFIADYALPLGGRVRRVTPRGIISTIAGGGNNRPVDGAVATNVSLIAGGLALDGAGNLLISGSAQSVYRLSPGGIFNAIAGNGLAGYSGDGGQATSAQLSSPTALAFDGSGNLFITDAGNDRVRRVSVDGTTSTVAGTSGCCSSSGDGGPAITAQLAAAGLAADGTGNVYIADPAGNVVRVLRPTAESVLIGGVVDAASQQPAVLTPGKILVIYGARLGPDQLVQNQPANGQLGTDLGGTEVSFNGIHAPILYTSATHVAVVVPYEIEGASAQVSVAYQGQASPAVTLPVAPSAPSIFTLKLSYAPTLARI